MGSDAVNALVEERHRVEAVRAYCFEVPDSSMLAELAAEWLGAHERGVELKLGVVTDTLDAFSQSLANLEAAIRSEYKGVVGAAGLVRAEFETYGEAKASSAACRNLVARLEKLNDAK